VIISNTEPFKLRELGTVSTFPEEFGCDLLMAANGTWAGVQRKEVKDLLGSIGDGRLGEQILKMATGLEYRMLVIEGSLKWTLDGELVGQTWGRGISRANLRKLLWSVRAAGVWVEWTDTLDDTIGLVLAFEQWCRKEHHSSLGGRAGVRSSWGKANNRDYQIHLLQGLPGVGVELAGRILDQLGMPFGWRVGREELLTVDGLGNKKVDRMMEAINPC
jgi:ERCC4-type nuclease